jgi:hypothetical protein
MIPVIADLLLRPWTTLVPGREIKWRVMYDEFELCSPLGLCVFFQQDKRVNIYESLFKLHVH